MDFFEQAVAGLQVVSSVPLERVEGRPLVVGLHGRGSEPRRLEPIVKLLGTEHLVHVLPQGLLPHDGGRGWFDPGAGRPQTFPAAREALLTLLSELRTRTGQGPERTLIWGFSQGGSMALEVGLRSASALAGTAALAGRMDPLTAADGALLAKVRRRRVLLVHGVKDEVIPSSCSREAYGVLAAAGADVQVAELAVGHELGPLLGAVLLGFAQSVLPSTPVARA